MSDKDIRLLLQALGSQLFEKQSDPTGTVAMLISETVKFRDKLKEDTGEILTVGDTRVALDALERHLDGEPLPGQLTPEQKTLTQIWIDRLTLFK
jgi:hypothetical protein